MRDAEIASGDGGGGGGGGGDRLGAHLVDALRVRVRVRMKGSDECSSSSEGDRLGAHLVDALLEPLGELRLPHRILSLGLIELPLQRE